jgi:hypothetical protein
VIAWLLAAALAGDGCEAWDPSDAEGGLAARAKAIQLAIADDTEPDRISTASSELFARVPCASELVDLDVWTETLLDYTQGQLTLSKVHGIEPFPDFLAAWTAAHWAVRSRFEGNAERLRVKILTLADYAPEGRADTYTAADFEVPPVPEATLPVPRGVAAWLDGRREEALPTSGLSGLHLLQVRRCESVHSFLLTDVDAGDTIRSALDVRNCGALAWHKTDRALLTSGLVTGGAGAAGVLATWLVAQPWQTDPVDSRLEREALRGGNATSWALVGVGTGLVVAAVTQRARRVSAYRRSER